MNNNEEIDQLIESIEQLTLTIANTRAELDRVERRLNRARRGVREEQEREANTARNNNAAEGRTDHRYSIRTDHNGNRISIGDQVQIRNVVRLRGFCTERSPIGIVIGFTSTYVKVEVYLQSVTNPSSLSSIEIKRVDNNIIVINQE